MKPGRLQPLGGGDPAGQKTTAPDYPDDESDDNDAPDGLFKHIHAMICNECDPPSDFDPEDVDSRDGFTP